MSEDKRISTGQGIVMTVFPIAGLVVAHVAYGMGVADGMASAMVGVDNSALDWMACVCIGGVVGLVVGMLYLKWFDDFMQ